MRACAAHLVPSYCYPRMRTLAPGREPACVFPSRGSHSGKGERIRSTEIRLFGIASSSSCNSGNIKIASVQITLSHFTPRVFPAKLTLIKVQAVEARAEYAILVSGGGAPMPLCAQRAIDAVS